MAELKRDTVPNLSNNHFVNHCESIIRNYIIGLRFLAMNEPSDATGDTVTKYIEKILVFVNNHTLARLFTQVLTREGLQQLWSELRKEPAYLQFVMHLTSELKMYYGKEEWDRLISRVAFSHTFFNVDNEYSLPAKDIEFSVMQRDVHALPKIIAENDWVVCICLINQMSPIAV
nr:MAG TPA: hypothetical protein [Caudoviricetes sp.]